MRDSIDKKRIGPYLESHIDGFHRLKSIKKFPGGQSNPTFLITASSGRYVLRSQPPGQLLKSAHAVDREFRVLTALFHTDVPVARPYHLCEDRAIIGQMFYVMSYEEGSIFWDPALPDSDPESRAAIYNEMCDVLAKLHALRFQDIGLEDFGRPQNYFGRQVSRWTQQYRQSQTDSIPAMEMLINWLADNVPDDDGKASLIHGDYRLDNIIFRPHSHQALAVLDWELSTIGHPFADIAYQCMQLRMPRSGVLYGLESVDRSSLGIPTEEEYVESYCARMEIAEIANWEFYLAFSFFKFAAIFQGIQKRSLEGNASSDKAHQYGSSVPILAERGVALLG